MMAYPPPPPAPYVIAQAAPIPSSQPGVAGKADENGLAPNAATLAPSERTPAPQGTAGGAPAAQSHLFGDWFGLRTRLENAGITPNIQYIWMTAYNLNGGTKSKFEQTGQFTVGATFDLNKLIGLRGGKFQALITNRNGGNINDDEKLGLLQFPQAVWGGGQIWRLSQLWYQQSVGPAQVKLGRMSIGEDFGNAPCFFESLYFCGIAVGHISPQYWYNPPISVWGTNVRVADRFGYSRIGLYERNPTNSPENRGFYLGFKGRNGAIIPFERGFAVKLGGNPARAGIYKVGVWYDTSKSTDLVRDVRGGYAALSGEPLAEQHGRWGGYFVARQQVLAPDKDGRGGLEVNFTGALTDKRTTLIDNIFTLSATYSGLIPSRPKDQVGLAFGRTHINGRLQTVQALEDAQPNVVDPQQPQHVEYAIEATYSVAVAEGLAVRPNVQWYVNPSARSDRHAITILGLSVFTSF